MSDKKVLIVEDDEKNAVYLKNILEAEGYKILGPSNTAEKAIEIAIKNNPGLIIMDIGLNGITNGIETAHELKKYNIPIIFLTALNNKETYSKAKKIRPLGYITKPFDEKELLDLINLAFPENEKPIPKEIYLKELQKKNIIEEIGERAFKFFENYYNDNLNKLLVVSTTTKFNIDNQIEDNYKLIINLKKLNNIQRINKFLESVNLKLNFEGIFIGHAETKGLKKKIILKKHPIIINYIFYFIYFLYKRVWPKLPYLRKLYFFLTKGRNRSMSRAEVLGRLYSCGFDVIEESFIESELHFIAKKIKKPFYNLNASYDLIFKMPRVGKGGKMIHVYKLRTMHPYSEYIQEYIYKLNNLDTGGKIKNDFRISSFGRFARRFWIDELPMIINLFKGDLKIVGVRPLSTHFFNLYSDELKEKRIKTKPGLVPPYYAQYPTPKAFEEVLKNENEYLDAYFKNPFITDWKYFWRIMYNIIIKRARSK